MRAPHRDYLARNCQQFKYPGVKELTTPQKSQSSVVPMTFVKGLKRFSYFSIISTIGLPQDITAQEFRIECMFPAESSLL